MERVVFDSIVKVLTFALLIFIHRKEVKHFLILVYNYAPLVMSRLIMICGFLFYFLSSVALLQDLYVKSNSMLHATGIAFLFIVFGIITYPLSRVFYKEYKDPKNKLIA
ncbi:hypothetical protein [Aquimarina pacifica]|uniref:hypothetical protein n=1 Tax=Aquimarina pacifica TaxID=1296415 RepID=UPI000471FCDB|nr:hypothetical protein [Aquimarina pacifica]